ncbi:MAG: hypothetical protein CL843_15200 [Crocinitomicaceae bacterium]|nr:hypothetical protein [Crocinitomicaceae bacterium]
MDHLAFIVERIPQEIKVPLLKKINNQEKKMRLFQAIANNPSLSNQQLNILLGYPEGQFNNLYTLKNRLYNDIVETTIDQSKNLVVLTKEKVQNLRHLAYSKNRVTTIRELKKQEKRALELELYAELKEIYFCLFLIFKNNPEKSSDYSKLADEYNEKQQAVYRLEKIFFSQIVPGEELFYRKNEAIRLQAFEALETIEQLDNYLGTKSSRFFYLMAKLTIHLTLVENIKDVDRIEKELKELQELFQHSNVSLKYPDANITILILTNRFYFLSGDKTAFYQSRKRIRKELSESNALDHYYFFFMYVSIIEHVQKSDTESILLLFNEMFPKRIPDIPDAKTTVFLLYLDGVKHFYQNNFDQCAQSLDKIKKQISQLPNSSHWIVIDSLLLKLLADALAGLNTIDMNHTLSCLKRELENDNSYAIEYNSFEALFIRYCTTHNSLELIEYYNELKTQHHVLRPLLLQEEIILQQKEAI